MGPTVSEIEFWLCESGLKREKENLRTFRKVLSVICILMSDNLHTIAHIKNIVCGSFQNSV